MKLDPILQQQLQTYLPKSEILFITRAKLYVFNEGQLYWSYNCEGFFLILKSKTSNIITMIVLHAINLEVFFEMEHYSNFMNYAKVFIDKLFFMFLVPTNYIPLKFGLCLENRDEVMELKKVIDMIEFKDQVERVASNSMNEIEDVLSLGESRRLLRKAGVEDEKLQADLLFRQNVSNILSQHLKKDTNRKNQNTVSRFRALAFDQVQVEQAAGYAIEKEKEDLILKKLVQEVKQERIRNKY